jgi:hypothetical protein
MAGVAVSGWRRLQPVGADQALGDTALHHALEKAALRVALNKAPMRFFENVE